MTHTQSIPQAAALRYSGVAQALHWLMALVLIVQLVGGFLVEDMLDTPSQRDLGIVVINLHKATGILLLALSFLRLGWRLSHPVPPLPDTLALWEKLSARLVHWAFYALMIALPLSGWAMSSSGETRYPFTFFGLFPIPFLPLEGQKQVHDIAHELHEYLPFAFLALLALHIIAALKHQFLDRLPFLTRMWPGR